MTTLDFPPSSKLLFFYGTLKLPHILQQVLSLKELPALYDATIRGYTVKMWGPYPALVNAADTEATERTVKGKAWILYEEGHLKRLEQYETENYRLAKVDIDVRLKDAPMKIISGYTFIWNSYPEELEDGSFDELNFSC
ncbi:hypothetical protein PQX77_014530 [Marasmius sp. AFHP31]|nr:hypothetical protein PQX77_014530 [Marasmius sp. AFHP31]